MIPWSSEYSKKIFTAQEAVKEIKSNQKVFITGNASTPHPILEALAERAVNIENVEAMQVLAFGPAPHVKPELAGHLRVNNMFMGENVRQAVQKGYADYTPIFLGEISELFRTSRKPDVAIIQVSPPDEHGFCSFGCEVGISKSAAQVAKVVIAEVNEQMPRTLGDSFIHCNRIRHMVPSYRSLPVVTHGESYSLQEKFAEFICGFF